MGLKRKKKTFLIGNVFVFFVCFFASSSVICTLSLLTAYKLLALEKVAVVGAPCRVSRHEAEDLRSERQHGGEGDGGQRAGVEQELPG